MNKMTIGIVFNVDMTRVILIKKDHPEWQKGKYNFPGGHYKEGETPEECISREFLEETGINIIASNWINLGKMTSPGWSVDILAEFKSDAFEPQPITSEVPGWFYVNDLPLADCLDNVPWLVAWAADALKDGPYYSTFGYQ